MRKSEIAPGQSYLCSMPDGSGRWPIVVLRREGLEHEACWVVARRLGGVNLGELVVSERRLVQRLDSRWEVTP